MYNVHIDDYIDVHPTGSQWTHARIIKVDPKSAQIKALYLNEAEHRHMAYWFHLEDSKVAPFKTKSVKESMDCNLSDVPSGSPSISVSPRYSLGSNHSNHSFPSSTDCHLDPFHAMNGHGHIHGARSSLKLASSPSASPAPKRNHIVEQLQGFGYDRIEVDMAMQSVSNPADINEVIEFIAANDMQSMVQMDDDDLSESDDEDTKSEELYGSNDGDGDTPKGPMGPMGTVPTKQPLAVPRIANKADHSKMDSVEAIYGLKQEFGTFLNRKLEISPLNMAIVTIGGDLPALPPPNEEEKDKVPLFGSPPILLPSQMMEDTDYGAPIPLILLNLKGALFANHGHSLEGIFRTDSDAAELELVRKRLENGERIKVEMDALLIADLIKNWFSMLPRRILDDVEAEKIGKCKNMKIAGDVIQSEMGEPLESYYKWLLDLCVELTKHEDMNKLSIKNMANAMAPCLVDNKKGTMDMAEVTKFVQLSILWRHFSE